MPASEDFTPLDTLKRYLAYRPLGNDPWTNTMRGTAPAPGQGFAPAGADPVLYPTASPLVNITEGDIKRATEVGLAASGGGLKGQQIRAYHSSPHDFDKFDLGKIGSGEGAQVYGHGLYFAENPAVSGQGGQYWNQFVRHGAIDPIEKNAALRLQEAGFDRQKAIASAQHNIDTARSRLAGEPIAPNDRLLRDRSDEYLNKVIAEQQAQIEQLRSGKPVGPRTYEVNINADPAHMLDWDKALGQMSPEIQRAVGKIVDRDIPAEAGWSKMTGERLHSAVGERVGGKPDVAAALREAGIPGIKYLDQGSRGPSQQIDMLRKQLEKPGWRPETRAEIQDKLDELLKQPPPSSNYVVFNPSIIDIVKKYGLAGLASAPALTSGLRDRENTP